MIIQWFSLLVSMGFAAGVVSAPSEEAIPWNKGQRFAISFEQLADGFQNPDMMYAPFMFWFWDEPLHTEKMKTMAARMIEQGINPGYAHPRRSMTDSPGLPDEQWLDKEWFDAFNAVTAVAGKHHAYFGYVDEYWWPSLRGNGRILKANPDLKDYTLLTETVDTEGGCEVQIPECSFAVAALRVSSSAISSSTLQTVSSGRSVKWKAPAGGDWRVYVFTKQPRNEVNYLDPRLGEAFIDIALKPYQNQAGSELGKTIVGDFVDTEGRYGIKLAWSDALASTYQQRYGRDIRLWLPLMLDKDCQGQYAKARWQWFDLVSDIYVGNFRKVVDWHTQKGMYCIANFWEESLPAQTLRVGDHMKMQRAYTMPGQDALHDGVLYVHDFKEAVSVGEFENRRVFSEMMGASQWSTFYPAMLKKAANCVTAWGISHTAPHGVFTNRQLEGNKWSPDWYTENPLFEYLHLWSDFLRRASYVNSFGHQKADVLLYSPLESVWMLTGGFHFDSRQKDINLPWSFPEKDPDAKRANKIGSPRILMIRDHNGIGFFANCLRFRKR